MTGSIRSSLSQPPKRLLQAATGISRLSGSDRRTNWIVGRRFVRQHVFELGEGLPESKRKSALALMVRKWAPFPAPQFAAQWVGNRACVYAWDADMVAAAIAEAGESAQRCTVWPETFFRAPMEDGIRLAQMSDGVEGQVWKGGLLAATRWWPQAPAPRDWAIFLRSAGVDLTQAPLGSPAVTESELLELPWTVSSAPVTDLFSLLQNERAAAIAAAVVAAPFLYYLAQAAVLLVGTMRVESSIAELTAANQSIRADRAAAFTNLENIETYLGLENIPSQFETMNVASALLSDSKVKIDEWNFDAGTLQLVIQADRPLEAPFFIEMFEKDEHFSNVSGTVGNQQRELRLSMQVDPKQWPTS
ncbi:MAG: hypothetical protein IT566_01130 [Rhodospirillaceae bacterium]|nr:hypothetical protein [Rhodospirillaceae bacterium]